MRSLGFTFVLALLAFVMCGLAAWTLTRGNLDALLGSPPAPVGAPLYPDFKAEEVDQIRISDGKVNATFIRSENGWQVTAPWQDRMDPRALVAILKFTQGLSVQDRAPADETDPAQTGLGVDAIDIRMETREGENLASYRLGARTPWLTEIPDTEDPVPTVFIQPYDPGRGSHVYTCAGDILALFNNGLRFLRDHHPLIPQPLEKIRIRGNEGELTLGRESPESAWRIIKPGDLPTDPVAMKRLIDGLVNLKAVEVTDRTDGTLPPAAPEQARQIAVVPFGGETETILEISAPATPDGRTAQATVSDRPGTVFELPLKPEPDLVSLADLPLSVNDLRDPTLTNLNIPAISSIAIRPSTGPEILISRSPPQPWMAASGGVTGPANEQRLFNLFKAVTEGRALRFETDAASDLSPWGLDRPFLRLLFLSIDHQTIELAFGMDSSGAIFVNRTGTPTVMRIDRLLLDQITSRPHEWRHARLWSLNRVYLLGIKRTVPGESPVTLAYRFIDERWTGLQDGKDVTANLDPARANFLLDSLEAPDVSRWLDRDDAAAATALETPSLVLEVVVETVDDTGEKSGISDRRLELAPAPEHRGAYYGRLSGEPHPFLIDGPTYAKFATDPLE